MARNVKVQNHPNTNNNTNPKIETLSVFDLPHSFSKLNFVQSNGIFTQPSDTKTCLISKEENATITITTYKRIFETSAKADLYDDSYDEERIQNMHPEDRPLYAQKLSLFGQLTLQKWVILLCHGGYFSGGVFLQKKPIAHKSFHHYVTRKKQGGRQSTKDKSKKPKSGGASLRRYNEEKHEGEVRKLMKEWKEHLLTADLIFYHLPGANKYQFLKAEDKKEKVSPVEFYLPKSDKRLRKIPFTTKRPTYTEVKDVFTTLSSVEVSIYVEPEVENDQVLEHINIRSSTEFVEPNIEFDSEGDIDYEDEEGEYSNEEEEGEESE